MYLFQKVFTYSVKAPVLLASEGFRLSDELWHEGHTEVQLASGLPLEVDWHEPVKNYVSHLAHLWMQKGLFTRLKFLTFSKVSLQENFVSSPCTLLQDYSSSRDSCVVMPIWTASQDCNELASTAALSNLPSEKSPLNLFLYPNGISSFWTMFGFLYYYLWPLYRSTE